MWHIASTPKPDVVLSSSDVLPNPPHSVSTNWDGGKLCLVSSNIGSRTCNRDSISSLLDTYSPNIIIETETRLTAGRESSELEVLLGYATYRNDRTASRVVSVVYKALFF